MKFIKGDILPKYVRAIRHGNGTYGEVNKGEVFDTAIPNKFSKYTWEHMFLKGGMSNWDGYFEEISEEEYCKAKGILLTTNYEIY